MRWNYCFLIMLLTISACRSQAEDGRATDRLVGGGCEGCEAIHEYGNQELAATDTLPGFATITPRLKITGVVYAADGQTPAEDVILYIYHTDRAGKYTTDGHEKGWGRRHGRYRGWVKTGPDGRYAFFTFRPASYPGSVEPAHIHLTVKEPGINAYYLDEYVFDDDPFLTSLARERLEKRGGSGISRPIQKGGILTIERDLILGLNIPDY